MRVLNLDLPQKLAQTFRAVTVKSKSCGRFCRVREADAVATRKLIRIPQ